MLDVSNFKAVELLYHGKGTGRYKYLDVDGVVTARQCKSCLVVKSVSDYSYSISRGLKKYKSECKPCNSNSSLKWNISNPEKVSASGKRYADRLLERTADELEADTAKMYPESTKICSNCTELLPLDHFYPDMFTRGGISSRCKLCTYITSRAWFLANPERARELDQAMRIRFKTRSADELLSDQMRIHPSGLKRCKSCKDWFPFTFFYYNNIRYDGMSARCAPCSVKHTSLRRRQRRPKYWASRGIPLECYMCGDDFEVVEHVVPLALGGPDTDENTLPSCAICNGAKSDIPLETFVQRYEDPAAILARVESYGVSWKV